MLHCRLKSSRQRSAKWILFENVNDKFARKIEKEINSKIIKPFKSSKAIKKGTVKVDAPVKDNVLCGQAYLQLPDTKNEWIILDFVVEPTKK